MSNKALIIVDMLNDFIDEKGSLYCGETAREIIPLIQERLQAYREQGGLVIYLQDSHDENDKEFEKFPKHCVANTWGGKIIAELAPLPNEKVVPKKRYSGFSLPGIDAERCKSELYCLCKPFESGPWTDICLFCHGCRRG